LENPCFKLLEKLDEKLIEVDQLKISKIKKCSTKVELCQELSQELRQLYFDNKPRTSNKEIYFFKELKPRFYSELFFHIEVFNYYKNSPKGSIKAQKHHIDFCLDKASSFILKHCEFHNYIKLSSTHLDHIYFTNRDYDPKLHAGMEYPSDPLFSSPADPTLSCLLTSIRYLQFLKNESFQLDNPKSDPSVEFMKTLDWNKSTDVYKRNDSPTRIKNYSTSKNVVGKRWNYGAFNASIRQNKRTLKKGTKTRDY